MLRIGIVGCGHWGSNHLRVFNASGKVAVAVVCDKDEARLERLRKEYPGTVFTKDYTEVIHDQSLDALVIATPTATHYQLVKSALENNKHVLCEKPLAVRERESRELYEIARTNKKILMVGYVFLFNNGIIALKENILEKKLGKVLYLHFTRTNLGPIRDDVDVIYDLASHDISISSFLLDAWPQAVSGSAGFFLRKEICDTAFVTLYYPRNILVHIHVSWLDPRKIRKITCVGDDKMAVWDDLNTLEPIRVFNKGVVKEPYYSDYGEFQLLPREGEVVSPLVKLSEPLKKQDSYFIECVEKNIIPLTDAKFAHNITKVLESIEASIKNNGKTQTVEYADESKKNR